MLFLKKQYPLLCALLLLSLCTCCQPAWRSDRDVKNDPSILQYPVGYPNAEKTSLQQLGSYPLPRYMPGNHLQRLFNWIVPDYLGAVGNILDRANNTKLRNYFIQQELITNWNYGIIIANAGCAFNGQVSPVEIKLANEHPEVSLDVITFWTQGRPQDAGYKGRTPEIFCYGPDSPYTTTFTRDGNKTTEIKFNFPDSLIHIDGLTQRKYLQDIIKLLKRPINRINENGEEPPGPYVINYLHDEAVTRHMKDSMHISSWEEFASVRKLQMRNVFSQSFMSLPELKDTHFNFYIVEGGPIDRFNWHVMKKCMTPVNGIYYSTPDFYPRWPHNWKDWQGAWHGWKWISIGRQVEIKDGDYLFSPFVAAGWSKKNEENITPGQWLGLLKCLAVIGAEYYYVGYFNLGAPFANPADYAWQAAMPAYAQAITSRFEDVLKNGNVLFDADKQPIISYPTGDKHVLVTAREANNKMKYVICGTYQPFSNDSDEIAARKNVSATIDGHALSFEVRRQGSVYIYEKTPDNRFIFYQLDKWHENAHPDHWSKDFNVEAEVADSGIDEFDIYTETKGAEGDYTNFTSYIDLKQDGKQAVYHFGVRDSVNQNRFLWVRYKGDGTLKITLSNDKGANDTFEKSFGNSPNWQWVKIEIPTTYNYWGNNTLSLQADKGDIKLDKFVISTKAVISLP